ncbi:MAG TPA: hypothetical protein PK431_03115 [Chitinophagales bacterium]|jgi:hypothetical protein|nr:hypothetical protein [Chitinophagales bacterium]
MKFKTNIPALLMALLVFIASNGVILSEHICNSTRSHNYSLFTKADCGMEKPVTSCCPNKTENKNKCCEHKQFFKKLPIEGFTANQIALKPFEKLVLNDYWINSYSFNHQIYYDRYIAGIPPPDNLYIIKYLLRPTPVELQIFRC